MKNLMKLARYQMGLQIFLLVYFSWLLITAWNSGDKLSLVLAPFGIVSALWSLLAPNEKRSQVLEKKIAAFRETGLYPPLERATDEDVRRLLQIGEMILAVRLYRETHGVPFKEAFDTVKRMK